MYIYMYIHILFHVLFHYGLSQEIGYSSLGYTVRPCCLSMLYIIAYNNSHLLIPNSQSIPLPPCKKDQFYFYRPWGFRIRLKITFSCSGDVGLRFTHSCLAHLPRRKGLYLLISGQTQSMSHRRFCLLPSVFRGHPKEPAHMLYVLWVCIFRHGPLISL